MALRLVVYDATCAGRGPMPGLTTVWRAGTRLFGALGAFDAWYGARTWREALDWLARVEPSQPIGEIQYWGHGRWGRAVLASESLDVAALRPEHALHDPLRAVRERLDPGGALLWFRSCEVFGTEAGHRFAREWTDFFGCRAAGHTYIIHAIQSGLHSLAPGEVPAWSVKEGVPDAPAPRSALRSRFGAVNTITILDNELPAGF